jgi:hypothetical protein
MRKRDIIRGLGKQSKRLEIMIEALNKYNSGDAKTDRLSQNVVAFTLFDLVDDIGKLEVEIYNYFRRKGKR